MVHSRDLFQSPNFYRDLFQSPNFYMRIIEWPHLSSDRGAYSPPTFLFSLYNVMQYACFSIIHIQPYHSKWLAPHKCQYSQWITIHSQSIISYSHDICFISIPHSITNQHLYKRHTHVTKNISLKSYSITIYIYILHNIYISTSDTIYNLSHLFIAIYISSHNCPIYFKQQYSYN